MSRRTAVSVLDDLASRLGGWTLSECASLLEGVNVEVDGKLKVMLGHDVSHGIVQLRLSGMKELVNAQTATLAYEDVADIADVAEIYAERDAERKAQREATQAAAAEEQRRAKVEKACAEAAAKAVVAMAEKERVEARFREATANAEATHRQGRVEHLRLIGLVCSAQEGLPCTLLSLDDDLLLLITRALLAEDLRAALRLLQTCTEARTRLDVVKADEAVAAAAEAGAAFAELQRQATSGTNWDSSVTRQGDWAISRRETHKEDSMSVSTRLYYLRGGQPRCVREARWREHDTMRGGNDGSKLRFGGPGELLEHQFEGETDHLRLADLVP